MRLKRLASLNGHLLLALNWQYNHFNLVGRIIHGDLAVALIIFGLVTFATLTILQNKECYPLRYATLSKVGKLGGGMWL